jgi:hypothetical protein
MKVLLASLCIAVVLPVAAASPEFDSMMSNASAVEATSSAKRLVIPHGNIHVTTTPGVARTYDAQGRWLELATPRGSVYFRYANDTDEWPSHFSRNGVVWTALAFDANAGPKDRFQSLVAQMTAPHGKALEKVEYIDAPWIAQTVDDILADTRAMDEPETVGIYGESGTETPAGWWDTIVAWWNRPVCQRTCDSAFAWGSAGCAAVGLIPGGAPFAVGCGFGEVAIWEGCSAQARSNGC